jgi:hypothetical protein
MWARERPLKSPSAAQARANTPPRIDDPLVGWERLEKSEKCRRESADDPSMELREVHKLLARTTASSALPLC